VTLNTAGSVVSNKLIEVQEMVTEINNLIQQDIGLINQAVKDRIDQLSEAIKTARLELEQSLKNIILTLAEGAVYVLDVATYNTIMIVSLVLLGIGLLVLVLTLYRQRLPDQAVRRILFFVGAAAYITIFGLLALVPTARATAMARTGWGAKLAETAVVPPTIISVRPDPLLVDGNTDEVLVSDFALMPDGHEPQVTLTSRGALPVKACTNERVVVDVSSLTRMNVMEGSQTLRLIYGSTRKPLASILRIQYPPPVVKPPDLAITGMTVSPLSPVMNVDLPQVVVTVKNQGQGAVVSGYWVLWYMLASVPATIQVRMPGGLNPGQQQQVTLTSNMAYDTAGTFDTLAMVKLSGTSETETDPSNNSFRLPITVRPQPVQLLHATVKFTKIRVYDDTDADAGDIYLDLHVNQLNRRWPATGDTEIADNEEKAVNEVFSLDVPAGERIKIIVVGTEADSGGSGNDDDMGTVNQERDPLIGIHAYDGYASADGSYRIYYTITVTQ
jgi:hypothetical protein